MTTYETKNEDFTEIDLRELFFLLVQNAFLIIGLTLIGAFLAFMVTFFFIKPNYASTSTVYIQPKVKENQVNYTDVVTNEKLTNTYTEIAKSRSIVDKVAILIGNQLSKPAIINSLKISSIKDTQIISITATTNNAALSAKLTDSVVTVFVEEIRQIMDIDNLTVIDKANINPRKVSPNTNLNTLIGAVLGMFLAIGIVLLKTMLDQSIKNRLEAERILDLPVLGEIYYHESTR